MNVLKAIEWYFKLVNSTLCELYLNKGVTYLEKRAKYLRAAPEPDWRLFNADPLSTHAVRHQPAGHFISGAKRTLRVRAVGWALCFVASTPWHLSKESEDRLGAGTTNIFSLYFQTSSGSSTRP